MWKRLYISTTLESRWSSSPCKDRMNRNGPACQQFIYKRSYRVLEELDRNASQKYLAEPWGAKIRFGCSFFEVFWVSGAHLLMMVTSYLIYLSGFSQHASYVTLHMECCLPASYPSCSDAQFSVFLQLVRV